MPHQVINGDLKDCITNDYKIVGFDESSYTNSGTYGKLAAFKFGEAQVKYKEEKFYKELIMYKPIYAYIEDNVHKLIIYRDVIDQQGLREDRCRSLQMQPLWAGSLERQMEMLQLQWQSMAA